MTREERLVFCNQCTHRKMDLQQGMLCGLTNEKASFEGNCEQFDQDTRENEVGAYRKGTEVNKYYLSTEQRERFSQEQNLPLGIIAGLVAGIVGAIIWAMITVATGYQIGFMAIGIGFIVGYAIRYMGKGLDPIFGFAGALIAIFSCLLGNFFGTIGFIADYSEVSVVEAFLYFDYSQTFAVLIETFSVMDVVFYAIAAYEGHRFAFRQIDVRELDDQQP